MPSDRYYYEVRVLSPNASEQAKIATAHHGFTIGKVSSSGLIMLKARVPAGTDPEAGLPQAWVEDLGDVYSHSRNEWDPGDERLNGPVETRMQHAIWTNSRRPTAQEEADIQSLRE